MKPVIFAGPTIGAAGVRDVIDADILPPVAQGDVYRVARQGPPAIGIIDGYFDGVPSVWHKEILWAIEQGIPVFGSASMGALRAAELWTFGMIGCGRIFEAYRDGEIDDDDEVAVLHGPAELGFVALSEPMVSVRATVARARDAGILTADAAGRVSSAAKAMHYRDRTWDAIIGALRDSPGLSDFLAWLPGGKVDAKRDDARAMLGQMAARLGSGAADDSSKRHRVERTLVWQGLVRRIEAEGGSDTPDPEGVLDELRLDPQRYEAVRDRAVLRSLALADAERRGVHADRDALRAMMDRHRRARGLSRRDAVLQWLNENDLDEEGYEALLHDAALVDEAGVARSGRLAPHMLAELRWSGAYCALRDRANDKAWIVDRHDHAVASPERLRLLLWFFEGRLGHAVPDDLDAYAVAIGLAGRGELFALIAREFMYSPDSEEPAAARTPD